MAGLVLHPLRVKPRDLGWASGAGTRKVRRQTHSAAIASLMGRSDLGWVFTLCG